MFNGNIVRCLSEWVVSEDGQGMVEYGLIVALVSVVLISILNGFAVAREQLFSRLLDTVNAVIGG